MADVEQMKKIVPCVTCEITFGQNVCELMLGVHVPNLNFGVQINSVKQPIQCNSVGSWYMSHCGTSAFYHHCNDGFIVLKDFNIALEPEGFTFDETWSIMARSRLMCLVGIWLRMLGGVLCNRFRCSSLSPLALLVLFGGEWNTSITKSQWSRAGIPSMREPASRKVSSASDELCETEVWFLHIQLIGTNVWLPKMHNVPPDVHFESSRSRAKSESWKNHHLHCCALFPTWQHRLNSLVWWMYEIKRAKRLSQASIHFVTARASLFTYH